MDGAYLAHYREHGYAVVRALFAPDEVAGIAAAFDRLYARGLAHGASFRHGNLLYRVRTDADLGPIVPMVQWPAYIEPVLERTRRDPRLLDLLAPLLGRDLKQIINQLHWKPPWARGVGFSYHQDALFRRPAEAYRDLAGSYVQTGIAIDPHGPRNGGMRVYPGSHRRGILRIERPGRVTDHEMADADLAALGLDPAGAVDLELAPGDIALWHPYTVHGSGPNPSAGDRRFFINGYVRSANCDRGEWAFRDGAPCPLGEPVLVHYEDLHIRPEPHYTGD